MGASTIRFRDLTYAEIENVYLDNIGLETIDECVTLLKAIRALRLRRPTESEKSGERITLESLMRTEEEAHKALAILRMASRCPTIIVPPDDLH